MRRGFVVAAVLAAALGASAPCAAQPNVDDANQRVAQGEQLFAQGDYDGALAQFERAYDVIGNHPRRYFILYNIGQAHERRFRYDLAMRYYRRYLDEGGPSAPDRGAVMASIRALEGLLATVRVEVNVPHAEVWAGDRQVGEAPGDVLVPGGLHVLEVRARGYAPERRQVQLAPRTTTTVSFSLSEYGGAALDPAWFWITSATAVVAALTGGGFGVAALLRRDEIDQQLMDPVLARSVGEGPRAEIQTLTITADILFGTALLFATTAVVLALFTRFDGGGSSASPSSSASVRVAPMVGESGGGLAVEVRW